MDFVKLRVRAPLPPQLNLRLRRAASPNVKKSKSEVRHQTALVKLKAGTEKIAALEAATQTYPVILSMTATAVFAN